MFSKTGYLFAAVLVLAQGTALAGKPVLQGSVKRTLVGEFSNSLGWVKPNVVGFLKATFQSIPKAKRQATGRHLGKILAAPDFKAGVVRRDLSASLTLTGLGRKATFDLERGTLETGFLLRHEPNIGLKVDRLKRGETVHVEQRAGTVTDTLVGLKLNSL